MSDVSKFISINGNGENGENNICGGIGSVGTTVNPSGTENSNTLGNTNSTANTTWEAGNTWGIGNTTGNSTGSTWKIGSTCTTGTSKSVNGTNNSCTISEENGTTGFRVCGSSNNLPAKLSFWSKIKSFFFYTEEEVAAMKSQNETKTSNTVCEKTQQESTWTKIVKWFLCEDDSSQN